MKKLANMAKILKHYDSSTVEYFLSEEYPNLNYEIIHSFLARHMMQDIGFFKDYMDINLSKCIVEEIELTSEQVLEIEYASFCGYKNTDVETFEQLKQVKPELFIFGTFSDHIILIERNGEYVALDGNNRLRMLKCYILNAEKPLLSKHKAYLLKQKNKKTRLD
mgnify:CR=1 FL=1